MKRIDVPNFESSSNRQVNRSNLTRLTERTNSPSLVGVQLAVFILIQNAV